MNSSPVLSIIAQAVTPYNALAKSLLKSKDLLTKAAGKCGRAPKKSKADTSATLQY